MPSSLLKGLLEFTLTVPLKCSNLYIFDVNWVEINQQTNIQANIYIKEEMKKEKT